MVAAVLGVLMAIGGLIWFVGADGDDQDASTSTSTTVVEPTESAVPIATTTSTSSTVPPSTLAPIDGESLPAAGIGVHRGDGLVALLDMSGTRLGTVDMTDMSPATRQLSIGLGSPPLSGPTVDVPAEVPLGCDFATADGGVRVALCGEPDRPRRIEHVDAAGQSTQLIGAPPANDGEIIAGLWRRAMPSPDGRWMLASWSGECEALVGFVLSLDGEADLTADGGPISEWQSSPEAEPLGWAPDGRAIVALGHGACGYSAAEPGVYLLDPTTGTAELVYESDPHDRFLTWTSRYPHTNGLERLALQALDDLGYEQCCGEPSHGGGGVSTGAVFEGSNLAISGSPTTGSSLSDIERPERVEFGPGKAVVYGSDTDRTIGFLCGDFTWSISWIFSQPPADVDTMVRLGEALLPHLACTLNAPPL